MAQITKLAKLQSDATRRSGERADKKRELAGHTISTLSSLGYARTSLRDIAAQSGVSLGVLHYYFEDKADLITYSVQLYKERFIEEIDATMDPRISPEAVAANFIDSLVAAVAKQGETHRLWYDIRAQALFDDVFRSMVNDIEDALIAVVGRVMKRLDIAVSPVTAYLGFDSLFRYYLQRHLAGDKRALFVFRAALAEQLDALRAR